jgi:FkbM family methyltransferase
LKGFHLNNVVRFFVRILVSKMNFLAPALISDINQFLGKGDGSLSTKREAQQALSFLRSKELANAIVLDVGANIGSYTQAILDELDTVCIYAFEPSTAARKNLIVAHGINPKVIVEPFALAHIASKATLYSDHPGSGLASLTKRQLDYLDISFECQETVETLTLDSWAAQNHVMPTLIKLDVEGHELDVLRGGKQTINTARVVQFEFGGCNIDTRTFFRDFWIFFSEAGFDLYRVTREGPKLVAKYLEDDECFKTTNYLAVKRDTAAAERNL